MLTDPIADMLSRIRNANRAMHDSVSMPTSRMKEEIARLLHEEGYIKGYRVVEATPVDSLVIDLKFGKNRERVITDLKRVSKPGRRVYAKKDRLPRVRRDHEEHIALGHQLAGLQTDLVDVTGNTGANLHAFHGVHVAEQFAILDQRALLDRSDGDGRRHGCRRGCGRQRHHRDQTQVQERKQQTVTRKPDRPALGRREEMGGVSSHV